MSDIFKIVFLNVDKIVLNIAIRFIRWLNICHWLLHVNDKANKNIPITIAKANFVFGRGFSASVNAVYMNSLIALGLNKKKVLWNIF
jgi:hypothetical protein